MNPIGVDFDVKLIFPFGDVFFFQIFSIGFFFPRKRGSFLGIGAILQLPFFRKNIPGLNFPTCPVVEAQTIQLTQTELQVVFGAGGSHVFFFGPSEEKQHGAYI